MKDFNLVSSLCLWAFSFPNDSCSVLGRNLDLYDNVWMCGKTFLCLEWYSPFEIEIKSPSPKL